MRYCERCGTVDTFDRENCLECGATSFERVTKTQLRDALSDGDTVETLDLEESQTVGTTPEVEFEGSPDVAVDGSVSGGARSRSEYELSVPFARVRGGYHKLRGSVVAPVKLLRGYLIPILAFVVVFAGMLWALTVLLLG